MSYSARIDELEKKFSENARRYFAPLANEYRKAGDLDRAIEICRAHLPQQPGHMSGHVVYGQALYESRQLDEAKTVFEAALALDPENLIALRHLGDIARDSGDPEGARTWYLRVLDADPRNDEVSGMLAELEAAAQEASASPPADQQDGDGAGWGDIDPEHAATGTGPSAGTGLESGARLATVAGEADDGDAGTPADTGDVEPLAPDAIDVAELALEPMPDDSVAGESVADDGRAEQREASHTVADPAAPRPAPPSLDQVLNDAFAPGAEADETGGDPLATAAFGRRESVEGEIAPAARDATVPSTQKGSPKLDDRAFAEVDALFNEISPPSERPARQTAPNAPVVGGDADDEGAPAISGGPQHGADDPPSAVTGDTMFGDVDIGEATSSAGDGERVAGLETREFVPPPRASGSSGATRNTGSMAVSGLTSFEQPSDEDSSTRAAFVTETMAELYLQQGFTAEALDIYRQLLEQNPEDTNLRERVEHLEQGGQTSLSVAAVSSQVIEAAQQRHAARPVRTARSFFGRIAGHQVNMRDAVEAEDAMAPAPPTPDDDEGEATAIAPPDASGEGVPEEGESATPEISVISDLFGEAPVNDADEAAASMLASAFSPAFVGGNEQHEPASKAEGNDPSEHAPPSGSGKAAHAAGRELSLDQVFRDSGARANRKSGGYSFDQFFSDGSPGGGGSRPTPSEGSSAGASEEDPEGDLEQFTAWLEGLKRK